MSLVVRRPVTGVEKYCSCIVGSRSVACALQSLSVFSKSWGPSHLSTIAQSDQSGLKLSESCLCQCVLNMQMPTQQFMKYLPT